MPRSRVVAFGAALVLAASACAGGSGGDDDGGTDDGAVGTDDAGDGDDGGDGDGGEASGQPGFDGCVDDPNTCNAGELEDGGEMVWLVDQSPDAWFSYSLEGGSVYTLQAQHGIHPFTGQFEPDGVTYTYNMDLLAAEPELLNDGEDGEPFQYQFQIRDEAIWDDGTPIGVDDFVVSWHMATSEAEGHCVGCTPRSSAGYDEIESIEGSDDGKTITVTLKEGEADAEWFALFNTASIGGGFMPAHVADQEGFDLSDPEQVGEYFQWLNENMPTWSGGPYRIAEGDLENQIIKEPNPEWYGEEPALDTFIIRYVTDQDAFSSAIANNEVQGGAPASFNSDVVTSIEQLSNVYLNLQPGPSWSHVDVNIGNEQLADVELRRAIFTAIDIEDIGQRTYGESYPEFTLRKNHIFGEESDYFEDVIGPTGQGTGDIDAATQILEGAGYEGIGETLTLDGEEIGPFRIRGGDTESSNIAMQLIQSYLAELGIEINIQVTDDLGGTLAGADYDLMIFGWSGSPLFQSSPEQFWSSESGSNFGGYSNEEVDDLVRQVSSAGDLDTAADFANQAAAIVADEAYVLPLLETPVYMFVTDAYANVRENSSGSLRSLYNNHEWGLVATQ